MSVGPLGFFGSIAATPALQRGADTERVQHDTARQQGEVKNNLLAESAAGIGETDGDEHDTNERDADGRRLWEVGANARQKDSVDPAIESPPLRQSKDLTGTTGAHLDLTG
ncbi:MAG: hypothetical protein WD894_22515 [Pirellulales bacterium]